MVEIIPYLDAVEMYEDEVPESERGNYSFEEWCRDNQIQLRID